MNHLISARDVEETKAWSQSEMLEEDDKSLYGISTSLCLYEGLRECVHSRCLGVTSREASIHWKDAGMQGLVPRKDKRVQ